MQTFQAPGLFLADIRVGRMCPQPALQQLDESRAGIVAVGADTDKQFAHNPLSNHENEPQSKPGINMVYPIPCKEITKTGATICGWDCPLLTFIYPSFDCGSNEHEAAPTTTAPISMSKIPGTVQKTVVGWRGRLEANAPEQEPQ